MIFENNFRKIFKFTKKLVNHEELRISAVVSTKKNLKEINEFLKQVEYYNKCEENIFFIKK